MKTFVGQHLARFKIPREIVFVDTLPRTALGKVQHFMLRERDLTSVILRRTRKARASK